MSFAETASVAKDIIVAGAAIVTSIAALLGIERWRIELRGKANYDTAREFARAMYRLRNEIKAFRSPLYWAQEFPPDETRAFGARDPAREAEAWNHVYAERWKPLWDALVEFDAKALEGEVLWGRAFGNAAASLRGCVQKLSAAAESDVDNRRHNGEFFKSDHEFAMKIRSTLADSNAATNEFTAEVSAAISDIERRLAAHLRRV